MRKYRSMGCSHRVHEPLLVEGHAQEPYIKRLPQAVSTHSVLSEPRRGPAMKLATIVLVCLAAAVITHADPEPHKYHHYPYRYYHHYPYHNYYSRHHYVKLPAGSTSSVTTQVHGLTKRSADPTPDPNPEPTADPDPSNSYSYQVVNHGHPHYGYHHGYRYPYNTYRYNHYYGYPHRYHSHHKRSVESEPEPEPHYTYYGRPHYYNRYYHGYRNYYPYYAGYRYHNRG
ncbi:uncharacterized histidine-rich protein DDB_G0274557-like [Penaeus indicus]|uniref:uncharacterized histidine-rich protein DDB_G0274557-like n=2 Tax=Penaeus indicus TaxID=29960 RepID=UPI00300C0A43